MKSFIYLSLLVCGILALRQGYAQPDCPHREYGWSATVGGEGNDGALDIAVDEEGNSFAVGGFPGRVDFDPSKRKDRCKAKGEYAGFVTSYTSGREYRWTGVLDGKHAHIIVRGIALSPAGKLLIVGSFTGKVDFDPGKGRDKIKSFDDSSDIFVTLLRSNGSYRWTRIFRGPKSDTGRAIDVDSAGNILVTGWFTDKVDFDPGPGEDWHMAVDGGTDVFVTKLGPDGSYRWTRTFGGFHVEIGFGIAADPENSVIVTGEFQGIADFDPGEGEDIRQSNGKRDFFITKLGADGSYHWTHTAGGIENDHGYDVTTDAAGNVYVTGAFQETVDFNPRGGGDVRVSQGAFDVYIIKLAADGSYRWTRTFGGKGGDSGRGIALSPEGLLAVTGGFDLTVDFDPSEGVDEHTSNGGWDVFITRFTTEGDYRFTDTFGGSERDGGEGLTFDADRNLITCGAYASQDVDFDPTGGVDIHSATDDWDIFTTKHYCGQCEVLDGHHLQGKRGKIKATIQTTVPGGSVKIEYTGPGDPIIETYDIDDTGQASFKLKKLKKGDYHCLITKIKDPAGNTLCQGPLAPRPVTVK